MVKVLCMLLVLSTPAWARAEPAFSVKTDKTASVLGEPLQLEIKALDVHEPRDVHEPLGSLNLDKLKAQFNVYGVSSNVQTQRKKGRTVSNETMTLVLYPLQAGRLTLPVFSYRGHSSKAIAIEVAESGKQTGAVKFKTAVDVARLHVRQAGTVSLEIYDEGGLQWSAPRELVVQGAHVEKLADSQREESIEGTRYTVHRYAWILMPLREGPLTLAFPLLDAMKLGTRLRYAVSPLLLYAAAVPAYLPVHVPIGKPALAAEPLPQHIALQRPLNWVLKVQGAGLSAEGLAKLFAPVHDTAALLFYPPQITPDTTERPLSAVQHWLVTIPLLPLRAGTLQLPEINLPYYDVEKERLDAVLLPASALEVINPLWHSLLMSVLLLVGVLAVIAVVYLLHCQWRRWRQKRKILKAVASAASVAELQQRLLGYGLQADEARPLTLQQWLLHMQQRYRPSSALQELVQQVLLAQYAAGVSEPEVATLAQHAARILAKLQPLVFQLAWRACPSPFKGLRRLRKVY